MTHMLRTTGVECLRTYIQSLVLKENKKDSGGLSFSGAEKERLKYQLNSHADKDRSTVRTDNCCTGEFL